jgi:ATP-dependent Clp protease ATP-binding subunit ClpX
MTDVMFDLPSTGEKEITITSDYASEKLERVNANKLKAA